MADYSETLNNVEEYYANLLILQYRNKPKARETIKLGVDIYSGDGVLFQIPEILNIDTATGAQLDLIGKILGCKRTVQGLLLDKNFFGFANNPKNIGYSRVNASKQGIFKTWQIANLSVYSLLDEDFRTLLKFKALINIQRASMAEMNEILYNTFGTNILLVNNQDLSISYIVSSALIVPLQAALMLGYFKAPIGVGLRIIINVPDPTKIYGFKKRGSKNIPVGFSRIGAPKQGTFLTRKNILNRIVQ